MKPDETSRRRWVPSGRTIGRVLAIAAATIGVGLAAHLTCEPFQDAIRAGTDKAFKRVLEKQSIPLNGDVPVRPAEVKEKND